MTKIKNFCKQNHKYRRLLKVTSLYLLIGILIGGSTINCFSAFDIDTSNLCWDLGNSDPDRILSINLTTNSSPRDNSVEWKIFPENTETVFINDEDTGPGVLVQFDPDPNIYTLTATVQNGPTNSIKIVVGPTARIISFIDNEPGLVVGEFESILAADSAILGRELTDEIEKGIGRGLLKLSELANRQDPPSADEPFVDDNVEWQDFTSKMEYRGYLYIQPVSFFTSNNALICSSLIKNDVGNGFTPIYWLSWYFPSEPHAPAVTPDNPSADRTHMHEMRIDPVGQYVFSKDFQYPHAPLAWHAIRYTLNVDGAYVYEISGSYFPSHRVYVNGVNINTEQHGVQTGLGAFLYSNKDGDDFAPGGIIATYDGTNIATACDYKLSLGGRTHTCLTSRQIHSLLILVPPAAGKRLLTQTIIG